MRKLVSIFLIAMLGMFLSSSAPPMETTFEVEKSEMELQIADLTYAVNQETMEVWNMTAGPLDLYKVVTILAFPYCQTLVFYAPTEAAAMAIGEDICHGVYGGCYVGFNMWINWSWHPDEVPMWMEHPNNPFYCRLFFGGIQED